MFSEKKLASISEYGDSSTTTTSLAGLSTYSNYTRSNSGESLNTLATSNRGWKNGLPVGKGNSNDRGKSLTHKHNYELCKKVRITAALIGISLLVAAIFMLSFYLPQQYSIEEEIYIVPEKKQRVIWDETMEILNRTLLFSTNLSETVLKSEAGPRIALKIYLGELVPLNAKLTIMNQSTLNASENVKIQFDQPGVSPITLDINKNNFSQNCYDIHWIASANTVLEDCFDSSMHWFGLGSVFQQRWPISKTKFQTVPFLLSDFIYVHNEKSFGGVLEPFAVNSKGGGIYVADTVPLHVSMNSKSGKFCIQANRTNYFDFDTCNANYNTNELFYTICIRENIRQVHKVMFDKFIDKPKGVPDKEMMLKPIWSTWVRYKKEKLNQENVLQFSKEIRDHKLEGSILEIDDQYSTEYGDYDFRLDRFNKAINMLQVLKARKFRVTMWVYPYSNFESKSFLEGIKNGYFVNSGRDPFPATVKWWDGLGGLLDTTNIKARDWFRKKLNDFKILPIDGFKFDSGEVLYLPYGYVFKKPLRNPNYFSYHYVELASEFELSEVRVAYKTQKFPVLVRLLDRSSIWGTDNGLQSVLTATLTYSILGYPFVLPDYVGGNAYIYKPRRELYIRWTQLCVFLPSIQFSLPPWDYDSETVTIVRNALAIRANLSEVIYDLAKNAQNTGEPIIRPLWWYWPTDDETFVIDSEFMLGKDYLIAPVLNFNVAVHAIYIPRGVWQEQWDAHQIINMTEGGMRSYNVTIHDICYFKLLSNVTSL